MMAKIPVADSYLVVLLYMYAFLTEAWQKLSSWDYLRVCSERNDCNDT